MDLPFIPIEYASKRWRKRLCSKSAPPVLQRADIAGKWSKTSGSAQSNPCGTSSPPYSCISTVTQKRPSKSMPCRSSKRCKTSQSDPCETSSPPSSSATCISTVTSETSFSQD